MTGFTSSGRRAQIDDLGRAFTRWFIGGFQRDRSIFEIRW
jgi:hypothetical protein